MSAIETRKVPSVGLDDLLNSINRMETQALQSLSEKVSQILASRQSTTAQELELLENIRALIPPSVVRRYRQLHRKQQNATISDKEQKEMLLLSDFMEEKSAERVALLALLAQLRKMPLAEVARQLRIQH